MSTLPELIREGIEGLESVEIALPLEQEIKAALRRAKKGEVAEAGEALIVAVQEQADKASKNIERAESSWDAHAGPRSFIWARHLYQKAIKKWRNARNDDIAALREFCRDALEVACYDTCCQIEFFYYDPATGIKTRGYHYDKRQAARRRDYSRLMKRLGL